MTVPSLTPCRLFGYLHHPHTLIGRCSLRSLCFRNWSNISYPTAKLFQGKFPPMQRRERCERFMTEDSAEGASRQQTTAARFTTIITVSQPAPIPAPKPKDLFYVFGNDENKCDSRFSVLRYDPCAQQATTRIADMESHRFGTTYSALDGSIYAVGGWIGQQLHSPRVFQFEPTEARWRERASLAVGRKGHTAVVCETGSQKLLCVFGGYNCEGDCLSSCELYNPSEDRWYRLPDMLQARSARPAAASLPGDCRIFVFGGWNFDSKCLATVEYCSLTEGMWKNAVETAAVGHSTGDGFWEKAARMLGRGRRGLAATTFRGCFIVAGGEDNRNCNLNTVLLFSPPDASKPAGQWTQLANMQKARQWFTLVTTADAIYALGSDYSGPYNTVEMFSASAASADASSDLTSWRWSSRSPIEELFYIVGAASLPQ